VGGDWCGKPDLRLRSQSTQSEQGKSGDKRHRVIQQRLLPMQASTRLGARPRSYDGYKRARTAKLFCLKSLSEERYCRAANAVRTICLF